MQWALVDGGVFQHKITNPINARGLTKTFTDLEAETPTRLKVDGIYVFQAGAQPNSLQEITDTSYDVDSGIGIVTENNTISYKDVGTVRSLRRQEIKDLRDTKLYAGIAVTLSGSPSDYPFQTDETSISSAHNLRLMILSGNFPGGGVDWRLQDNSYVHLDQTDATTVADAIIAHVDACYAQQKVHDDAIFDEETYPTVADVTTYDITTGWPTTL